MLKRTKHFLLIFLCAQFAFAGQWHQTYNNPTNGAIHDIAGLNGGGELYAAGDNGQVLRSYDQGHYWNQENLNTPRNFYSVTAFYFGTDKIIIAAGEHGVIARNMNDSPVWSYDSIQTTVNLRVVFYDLNTNLVWAAGDSGVVLSSADGGLSWAPQKNGNPGLFARNIARGNNNAYMVGVKNDSSFVVGLNAGSFTIAPGDTFPGIKLNDISIDGINDDMYLAGNSVATQNANIFQRTYNAGYGPPILVFDAPTGKVTAVGQFTKGQSLQSATATAGVSQILWFADDKGIIRETTDKAVSWHDAYTDAQNQSFNTLFINPGGQGPGQALAVAAGMNMNTVIENFELINIFPNQNDIIDQPMQKVELYFSAIPDLATIQDSIIIHSNLSGSVPYIAEYDPFDSLRVYLNLTRVIPNQSVPGEKWQINIPPSIRELHPNIFQTLWAHTINATFVPYNAADMDYQLSPDQLPPSKMTTNYVSGFFDSDGAPDLAVFISDSLVLYRTDSKGALLNRTAIYLGFSIVPNVSNTQLLKTDLNDDGMPDLLVFDNAHIYTAINQSGTSFIFSPGPSMNVNNLKQVALFDADNNHRPDMLVLNDSLYYRADISGAGLGVPPVYIDFGNTVKNTLHVADINNDGREDIFGILNDGNFYFQAYQGFGGFSPMYSTTGANFYTSARAIQSYSNGDHRMQVLVVASSEITMFEVDQTDQSRMVTTPNSPIMQATPDIITDIQVQDFGSDPGNISQPGQLDFILHVQTGAFKFFENSSQNNNGYTYTERPGKEVMGQPTETNMLVWDSDENGYLDILQYDPNKGSFSNLLNQAWGPQITNLATEPGGVRINWTGFDPVHGSFDFYRVWRDSTGPEMSAAQQIAFLTNIGDSTFLDTHTQQFMNYWYRVETGYNGNQVSNPSQSKEIQLIKFVSGALSGVLADTINGQYVPDSALVLSGQSLNIMPGVRMAFGNKAYLDIFGRLNVQGSEQQMVEFTNEHHDTVNTVWDGINIYPAADTVRFNWFSIDGADTALRCDGRPLWMKLGGIGHNNLGAAIRGDTLQLENVAFDSNMVAVELGSGTRALLKNILVIDNDNGLRIDNLARAHIRNSVLWFNGSYDLEMNAGSTVNASYSSIGLASSGLTGKEINQNRPPIFVPQADFYRPDPLSPTIDAGDPADDFSFEPAPNGGRINQGLYGGTFLASTSDRPHLVVTPSPINYNGTLVGSVDTIQVSFQNDGAVSLDISSIFIAQHNDVFSFLQQLPASIAPAGNAVLDLVFAPNQALSYDDTLFVDSNDPANPHFGVKINAVASNQNQPPLWNGLSALAFTEDQAEVKINLLPFVVDDSTPLENLIFGLVSNSDTTNIHGRVQDSLFVVDLTPDYFTKTPQQIILSAEDADGLVSNDTIEVSVAGIQDAPRFVAMPDTVIYTNVVFDARWFVYDVDGDTVHISDNTTLFTINPDSGFIKFTPLIADTGSYTVILSADDGQKSVSDTFAIQIKLNTIAPVLDLSLAPQDQAIDITFDMPANDFYTGTIVRYSATDTVFSPNDGILAVDSIFSVGSSVHLRINSLEINRQYFVSVFNFFQSAGTIYSQASRAASVTLAPIAQVDTSGTKTDLPVNKTLTKSILLKNMGGGTLIARFTYHPDSLTNVWFNMDTSQKTVGPGDSIKVGYSLHPNKKLPRGAKVVFIDFSSNEPGNDRGIGFPIVLQPIFDDFAPHVLITARSDSLLRESAFNLHYYLDDTTGYPIGEPDSGLFAHYRLFRLNPTTLIEEKDSVQSDILQFYPLEDGAYVLRIFGYDVDGNGQGGQLIKNIGFFVDNNHRRVLRNHWYMINVPRPVATHWTAFIPDSTAQIYRWKQDEERYVPLRSFPDLVFPKGMAVWAISNNSFDVDISSIAQASLRDTLSVAIDVGWNQIGAPLGYTTWWRDMQFVPGESATVLPLPQALQQDLIGPAVYHYVDVKDKQGYLWADIDTARAESWKGYWFYSKTAGHLIFSTKASDLLPQHPVVNQTTDGVLSKSSSISELRFSIALYSKGQSDVQNEFGLGMASPRTQILEPPAIGTQSTLYFSDASKHLARDMQPLLESYDDVRTWQAVVEAGDVSEEHILRWDADMGSRQGVYLYLVDNHREQIVDMQKTASYEFRPKALYSRFKIYATRNADFKPVIVPVSFTLKQNYPNPFNPLTHIRFGIPQSASGQRVQLQIYNTLGQQVAELINKPLQAGYHELIWKAVNLFGKPVASGLYFYKLSSGGNILTRKMLLLR